MISLAILGAAYILIFGFPGSHNKPTGSQRLAAVRTALDQTYIDSSSITLFHQDNAVAYATIADTLSQFKTHTTELEKASQAAGNKLTPLERSEIQKIIDSQKQVASSFQNQYSIVAKVVSYDPSSDLGSLDIQTKHVQLRQRATAASQGLINAADNNMIAAPTQQLLRSQADCFDKLASLSSANYTDAITTLTDCVNRYPQVRLAAIQDAIQAAFTPSYRSYIKQYIPPLLNQLDHRINY